MKSEGKGLKSHDGKDKNRKEKREHPHLFPPTVSDWNREKYKFQNLFTFPIFFHAGLFLSLKSIWALAAPDVLECAITSP